MADNIEMQGTISKSDIKNEELIKAINDMRENFNPDTQNRVINLALRAVFLVPAVVEKGQELVADENNRVQFQDKHTAKFLLINHKERGAYFPAFTSDEELKKMDTDQKFRPFAMKFSDLAGLTENTPNVKGFVINPFHENLPFTKGMLESIKQTLIKYRQAKENGEVPDITVSEKKDAPAE
jgi:hypothetical protein